MLYLTVSSHGLPAVSISPLQKSYDIHSVAQAVPNLEFSPFNNYNYKINSPVALLDVSTCEPLSPLAEVHQLPRAPSMSAKHPLPFQRSVSMDGAESLGYFDLGSDYHKGPETPLSQTQTPSRFPRKSNSILNILSFGLPTHREIQLSLPPTTSLPQNPHFTLSRPLEKRLSVQENPSPARASLSFPRIEISSLMSEADAALVLKAGKPRYTVCRSKSTSCIPSKPSQRMRVKVVELKPQGRPYTDRLCARFVKHDDMASLYCFLSRKAQFSFSYQGATRQPKQVISYQYRPHTEISKQVIFEKNMDGSPSEDIYNKLKCIFGVEDFTFVQTIRDASGKLVMLKAVSPEAAHVNLLAEIDSRNPKRRKTTSVLLDGKCSVEWVKRNICYPRYKSKMKIHLLRGSFTDGSNQVLYCSAPQFKLDLERFESLQKRIGVQSETDSNLHLYPQQTSFNQDWNASPEDIGEVENFPFIDGAGKFMEVITIDE
ncbi:hypothetical protein BABINDRAFT_162695 [Babjeviella inositovora NRRL Y-12698]|uniref:Uncharacterized protein n=1 Tax=Babjeviella inositovora NRRL Y-12698 TaxID=984486 RepID=A0A1E3QLC3_9ASCO|nr:uncharacterized protein BABINDRAFT_162695 [Babjeviella inositovora NRRL Y-12698]ODQ78485.1 hypothetical protein BABINDRAFT_162695 [Babjeviella inositovora NRRL Y-12698]